jgi:hypothetical protein
MIRAQGSGTVFRLDRIASGFERRRIHKCSARGVIAEGEILRKVNGKELTKMAYRHDAMLPSTPSRRIRPWKSAAPKCARKVAKNR